MRVDLLIGGGIALVALALTTRLLFLKVRGAWHPLGLSEAEGVLYQAAGELEPARLARAYRAAVQCLVELGPWDEVAVKWALRDVRIYVHRTPAWRDAWGRKVAGSQAGPDIQVGSDLLALCHELAHRCEEVIVGRVDAAHAKWATSGLHSVVARFHQELTK